MSNKNNEYDFSTALGSIKVKIDKNNYTISELTGAQNDEQLESVRGRMKFNADGKACGMENIKGIKSGLLKLCLKDSKGELVPEDIIIGWGTKTIDALHKIAQDLSGLGLTPEALEKAAKNG